MSRREFLRHAGGTAIGGVGLALLPPAGWAAESSEDFVVNPSWPDKVLWAEVKKAFVLAKESVYMNVGTTGSMPRHVLDNYDAYNRLVAEDPWYMGGEWGDWPYTTDLVSAIAPSFGAEDEQIVLSRNTTDGMCTILGGLQFEPGDVILTTHHEHIAAESPLKIIGERFGATVVELEIPVYTGGDEPREDDFVQVFQDAVALYSNVRLILFSHITYKTGTRLPAERICREVAIPNGILTLVDGAHTIGMIDLDLQGIGCDFYAGSGHKWQCGPGATGVLYVREGASATIDGYWPINASLYPFASFGFSLQQQLQYVGNDNYPAKRVLADCCAMWEEIGRDRIEEYVLGLIALCKDSIRASFGSNATLFSPAAYVLSSGLTAFNPFDDTTDGTALTLFRDRLREEYGYIVRTTNFKIHETDIADTQAIRISTHLFHDEADVLGLVDAMYDLYGQMS